MSKDNRTKPDMSKPKNGYIHIYTFFFGGGGLIKMIGFSVMKPNTILS